MVTGKEIMESEELYVTELHCTELQRRRLAGGSFPILNLERESDDAMGL